MTSAIRTSKSRRGFTLIEIVVVLAIAAMVTGGAVAFMVISSDKRALTDISGEVEVFAKRARTISILQQTPYALEFRQGQIRLLPFAEAGLGENERQTALGNEVGGIAVEDEPAPEKRQPVYDKLVVSEKILVSIRRWNTQEAIPLENKALQIWRFDPDGLCEPVSIRYSIDENWAEDSFHPLTAAIKESQFDFK